MIEQVSKDVATGHAGLLSAEKLMVRYDNESAHALHVRQLSMELFDCLADLHRMGDHERVILAAAATVHDIGLAVGASRHHKNSRDFVMEHGLPGFTMDEQRMVACIARYHRKAHPHPEHKVYRELSGTRQQTVARMASILRVADGLDRAHCQNTKGLDIACEPERVRIGVRQHRPGRADIEGAMRKKDLFEKVYGLPVTLFPADHERV